jgi:hypothetical protein
MRALTCTILNWTTAFRVSDRSGTPQAGIARRNDEATAEEYSGERDPEALRGDTPKKNTQA